MIGNVLVGLDYGGIAPHAPAGLFQRIALISACVWTMSLALLLMRRTHALTRIPTMAP
jgi:hypothetical protein